MSIIPIYWEYILEVCDSPLFKIALIQYKGKKYVSYAKMQDLCWLLGEGEGGGVGKTYV